MTSEGKTCLEFLLSHQAAAAAGRRAQASRHHCWGRGSLQPAPHAPYLAHRTAACCSVPLTKQGPASAVSSGQAEPRSASPQATVAGHHSHRRPGMAQQMSSSRFHCCAPEADSHRGRLSRQPAATSPVRRQQKVSTEPCLAGSVGPGHYTLTDRPRRATLRENTIFEFSSENEGVYDFDKLGTYTDSGTPGGKAVFSPHLTSVFVQLSSGTLSQSTRTASHFGSARHCVKHSASVTGVARSGGA